MVGFYHVNRINKLKYNNYGKTNKSQHYEMVYCEI